MTNSVDAATRVSLDYLSVLERRLRITRTSNGDPVFVPDRVSPASVSALRTELHDLLTGSNCDSCIEATRKFGEDRVQTVGFGITENFDLLVKLGFLYGQRLVLWDLIGTRLLAKKQVASDDILAVGEIACQLLLLRSVVEDGGAVILPPPPMWSEFSCLVADELRTNSKTTPSDYGLCMALSTVEDGLLLHPYTILDGASKPLVHDALTHQGEEFYSTENQAFHYSLAEMLSDQRLVFLQNISSKEFFRITRRFPELQHDIAVAFSQSRTGLSKVQVSIEDKKRIDRIVSSLNQRNGVQGKYFVDVLESTAAWSSASLVALASGRFNEAGWLFGATIMDLSLKLANSLRKWYAMPNRPVIIQAFCHLEKLAAEELETQFLSPLPLKPNSSEQSTGKLLREFTEPHWVEERHEYLNTLPLKKAQRVLEILDDDQIHCNVNVRRFQQAYIGDYLADVWTICSATTRYPH